MANSMTYVETMIYSNIVNMGQIAFGNLRMYFSF
jgi:hypothetical protein